MESEIECVVRKGVRDALPGIHGLLALSAIQPAQVRSDKARALRTMLSAALKAYEAESPRDAKAMAELLALDLFGRRQRKLNGSDGLRAKAGDHLDVGHDQFARVYEKPLIKAFAAFLSTWPGTAPAAQAPTTQVTTHLTFADVTSVAESLHRIIEQRFSPDLVITMSGPGSFAASYMMRYNHRDVPVLMAVTFPLRSEKCPAERRFEEAAGKAEWAPLQTTKWSIYIPNIICQYPPGSPIAIIDDRVITGNSQIALKQMLVSYGFSVQRAALFAPSGVEDSDLLVGQRVEEPFHLPWGSSRGRA